jgi:hypothetical protein
MREIADLVRQLKARREALAELAAKAASESMRAEYLRMSEMHRKLAAAERDLASRRSMASAPAKRT